MTKMLTLGLSLALTAGAFAQTPLKHDTYLELNGETQYLSVPSHPDFDIPAGRSYTYTFWVYGYRTFIYTDAPRIISRRDVGKVAPDSLNRSGYDLLALRTTSNNFLGASLVDAAGTASQAFDGWAQPPQAFSLRPC